MSSIRGDIGDRLKWICDIQIALRLGLEHLRKNPYEIIWPHWKINPPVEYTVSEAGS